MNHSAKNMVENSFDASKLIARIRLTTLKEKIDISRFKFELSSENFLLLNLLFNTLYSVPLMTWAPLLVVVIDLSRGLTKYIGEFLISTIFLVAILNQSISINYENEPCSIWFVDHSGDITKLNLGLMQLTYLVAFTFTYNE